MKSFNDASSQLKWILNRTRLIFCQCSKRKKVSHCRIMFSISRYNLLSRKTHAFYENWKRLGSGNASSYRHLTCTPLIDRRVHEWKKRNLLLSYKTSHVCVNFLIFLINCFSFTHTHMHTRTDTNAHDKKMKMRRRLEFCLSTCISSTLLLFLYFFSVCDTLNEDILSVPALNSGQKRFVRRIELK